MSSKTVATIRKEEIPFSSENFDKILDSAGIFDAHTAAKMYRDGVPLPDIARAVHQKTAVIRAFFSKMTLLQPSLYEDRYNALHPAE